MFSHIPMSPGPQAIFCRFFVSYIKAFERGFILLEFERGNNSAGEVETSQRSGEGRWERREEGPVFSARGLEGRTQHSVTGVLRWKEREALGRGVKICAAEGRSLWLSLCEPLQRERGFFRVQLFLLPLVPLSGSSCLIYLLK